MDKPYVAAMRIYLKDEHQPMADPAILKDGELVSVETIQYDDVKAREAYYINAYTLVWDERVIGGTFSEYVSTHI